MFGAWMRNNGFSLSTAAEALGISHRTVSYSLVPTRRVGMQFGTRRVPNPA